jgi:hypothetical protein
VRHNRKDTFCVTPILLRILKSNGMVPNRAASENNFAGRRDGEKACMRKYTGIS